MEEAVVFLLWARVLPALGILTGGLSFFFQKSEPACAQASREVKRCKLNEQDEDYKFSRSFSYRRSRVLGIEGSQPNFITNFLFLAEKIFNDIADFLL